ncbi:hypothetical protein GCM10012285_31990 [Streptomyces kronopolitis]|uniref:Uncharacterized protein n=1 Tax=Streptomyces kronopolitis TaxID=1612435 RepID=A0ABQ2JG79_9ACTN|nr:hypothetical protein GCM10012285_31990 [Streptomyces kronopolitis]
MLRQFGVPRVGDLAVGIGLLTRQVVGQRGVVVAGRVVTGHQWARLLAGVWIGCPGPVPGFRHVMPGTGVVAKIVSCAEENGGSRYLLVATGAGLLVSARLSSSP